MKTLKILSPLHRATRQIHLYLEQEIGEFGVSNSEGHLLTYLLSYAPTSIGELNRVFGFKRSTMTSILDRLEQAGLLERIPNPRDRRSWLVELTAGGRTIAMEIRKILDRFEGMISAKLSATTMAEFQRVIDTVGEETAVEVRKKD
jgi:DNA-binding MarR family transcriptional regulator